MPAYRFSPRSSLRRLCQKVIRRLDGNVEKCVEWNPAPSRLAPTVVATSSAVHIQATPLEIFGRQHASNLEFEACGLGIIRWIPGSPRAMVSRSIESLVLGRPAPVAISEPGFVVSATGVPVPARALWRLAHRADRSKLKLALARANTGLRQPARIELRLETMGGEPGWIEATVAWIEAVGDRPRHLFIATRDVSHQHATSENQRLYKSLFEHLQDGLLITDASGRVIDMNPAVTAMTGYSRADLLGHIPDFTARMQLQAPTLPPTAGIAPEAATEAALESRRTAPATWRSETVEKRLDGKPVALSLTASRMPASGRSGLRAVVMSDVTQARQQRDRLERRSQFDELTGLPNRSLLTPLLRQSMKEALSEGFRLTVCMLALDDFKALGESLGQPLGDELLVALAERLRKAVHRRAGTEDAVARLVGDDFVVLLRTATSLEARHAVERLLHALLQPYRLGSQGSDRSIEVVATASIGATIYPHDDADADTLLRHADHALYGARQAGSNGYVFFDPDHDRRVKERLQAVAVIQDGFLAEEFVLHYQPKVDMRLGRVLGVEALLRWRHPKRGLVSPAHFLPFIEHTDLGVQVGDWVLQRGITQLAGWLERGLDFTVSVNISARHLQQPNFAQRLAELLQASDPRVASRLVIEVLETAALEDVAYTRTLMRNCRALGVRFALDDFGTGYSTFTYLRQLPLDMLKIDQSFVRHMLDDRQDLAIVEGVIALSRKFGCTVIAEGVESQAHAERLIEVGCDVGQGNGIAMAMPADDVLDWVHDYHRGLAPHVLLRAASEPVDAA